MKKILRKTIAFFLLACIIVSSNCPIQVAWALDEETTTELSEPVDVPSETDDDAPEIPGTRYLSLAVGDGLSIFDEFPDDQAALGDDVNAEITDSEVIEVTASVVTGLSEGVAQVTLTGSEGSIIYSFSVYSEYNEGTPERTNTYAILRSGADENAEQVNLLAPAADVLLLGECNDYYFVECSESLTGFILKSDIGNLTDSESVSIIAPYGQTVAVNRTLFLGVEFTPEDTTNKAVEWSSDDEEVATVDEYGTVKGISEGTATITVESLDGGFTDEIEITVVWIPVESMEIVYDYTTLYWKEAVQLEANALPHSASDRSVVWASSNPAVASVDADGVLRGISVGRATISATTNDGSFTDSFVVSVSSITKPRFPHGISLPTHVTIHTNDSTILTATNNVDNSTATIETWVTDRPDIITVDSATGEVTSGDKAGQAKVTATRADGMTASIMVYVFFEIGGGTRAVDTGLYKVNSNVGEGWLNVRSEPDFSSDSTKKTAMPKDTVFRVTGSSAGDDWLQCTVNGTSNLFVYATEAAKVSVSSSNPSICAQYSNINIFTDSTSVSFLYYISPSTAYESTVETSSSDQSIAIKSSGVISGGGTAGIATITGTLKGTSKSVFSTVSATTKISPAKTGTISSQVNVRIAPSSDDTIGYKLRSDYPAGNTVTVYGETSNWYYVFVDGIYAYISKNYITLGSTTNPPINPPTQEDVESFFVTVWRVIKAIFRWFLGLFGVTFDDGDSDSGGGGGGSDPFVPPSQGIFVNPSSASLTVGGTQALRAYWGDGSGEVTSFINWSTSNSGVATVSASGVITGASVGTATITARHSIHTGTTATCTVSVSAGTQTVPVTKVTVTYGSTLDAQNPLVLNQTDPKTVTVTIEPANATVKTHTWTTNPSSSIATRNTDTFTGVSEGTTSATLTTNSALKTASFRIVVITKYANTVTGRMVTSQFLWTGPDTSYKHVNETQLKVNQAVTVYGTCGNYYYVSVGGVLGFVSKSNVGITVYMSSSAEETTSADLLSADYTQAALRQVGNISFVDTGRTEAWHKDNFWGLCALASPNGTTMYNVLNSMYTQFCSGSVISKTDANPLGAYTNASLTSELRKRSDVKTYEDVTITCLKEALSEESGNLRAIQYVEGGDQNSNRFYRKLRDNRDALLFGGVGDYANGFLIAIHNLFGSRLEIKNYQLNGNSYSGTLTFYLYDHFGLSDSDMTWKTNFHNGFASWFILQHYNGYSDYKPFITLMKYDIDFSGTL